MDKKIKIISLNISEKIGTSKHSVDSIDITMSGLEGDAHSGPWNRQVSLLGNESIKKFEKETGRKVKPGEFAENITTEGIELWKVNPLDRFSNTVIELEVTQIGKECHGTSCTIFKEVGKCVMPKEGIFCRVIQPGKVLPGTELTYQPKIFKVLVITLSDRASSGVYEDKSGPRIQQLTEEFFLTNHLNFSLSYSLIPDDQDMLRAQILNAKEKSFDFIFTSGGTGIGPRDFTPDVIKPLLDKEIPGIMEMIRLKFATGKPSASLSRSIAGISGDTLIYALPGSINAVNEYMPEIFKTLLHAKFMMSNLDFHT
jgi:molybdopterin adenylyltransferase